MSKPVILSLDTSLKAGFAIWNTGQHATSMITGVIEFEGDHSVEYYSGQMGLKICQLLREHKPDFVIMEAALKTTMNGAHATIISNQLHGAVIATCENMRILWGTIAVQSWRSLFFGQGFKPRQKITQLKKPDKNGKMEKVENLWKEAAVEVCQREGISLPTKKTIAHNAAEAAAMAYCWRKATIHTERDQKRFQELLQRRHERQTEAVA